MKSRLPAELQEIYDSVKSLKDKEMEPYKGEFDFSKLEKSIQPLRSGDSPIILHLSEDLAEAGKFMRAVLISKRYDKKTREAVEAYANALTIPYWNYGHPYGDEITTSIFFPSGKEFFFNIQEERFVYGHSGRYVLTVPSGLYINLKRKNGSVPNSPLDTIDWGTGSVQKEFSLNKRYFSQFLV